MSTVIHTSAWDDQVDAKNGRAVLALLKTIEKDRVEAVVIEATVVPRHWATINAEPSTYPGMDFTVDTFRISAWLKPSEGQPMLNAFNSPTVIATYCGWDNVTRAAAWIAQYFGGVPVWDWTDKSARGSQGDAA